MIESIIVLNGITTQLLYHKSYQSILDKHTVYNNILVHCNVVSALYQQQIQSKNYKSDSDTSNDITDHNQCTYRCIDKPYIIERTDGSLSVSYQHPVSYIVTTLLYTMPHHTQPNHIPYQSTYQQIVQYISDRFHQVYDGCLQPKQMKSAFNSLLRHTIYNHIQRILLTLLMQSYNQHCIRHMIDWVYVLYKNVRCDTVLQQLQTINLVSSPASTHTQHTDVSAVLPNDMQCNEFNTPDGALHIVRDTNQHKRYQWNNTDKQTEQSWLCCVSSSERVQPHNSSSHTKPSAIVYHNINTNQLSNRAIQQLGLLVEQCITLCHVRYDNLCHTSIQLNIDCTVHIQQYNDTVVVYQCMDQCEFDTSILDMIDQYYTLVHDQIK